MLPGVNNMAVRIFIGDSDEIEELADEFTEPASTVEAPPTAPDEDQGEDVECSEETRS